MSAKSFLTRFHRYAALAFVLVAGLPAMAAEAGKTWTVSPGQSIQEAIDQAAPGDTVQVLPGEYVQTVAIAKDDITLKGLEYERERTTLKARDAEEDEPLAQAISVSANNVTVEGFVIEGFSAGGVLLSGGTDLAARDLLLTNTGSLGVSVDGVQRGVVDRVVAGGMNVAGISVTKSSEITISNSEVFRSRLGLGMEGTEQVTVENCSFHQNAVGVLLLSTTKESGKTTSYTKFLRSRIMGSISLGAVLDQAVPYRFPSGVGILVWGADHTEVAHCFVSDNATMGIMTLAFDKDGARHLEKDAPRSGPSAENTYTHHNTYANNGAAPSGEFTKQFGGIPTGDLYWDGLGEKNQWQENTKLKTYPEKLVVKQGGVHTDVIHFQ